MLTYKSQRLLLHEYFRIPTCIYEKNTNHSYCDFFDFAANAQVKGTLIDSEYLKPIENAVISLEVKLNPGDTSYFF